MRLQKPGKAGVRAALPELRCTVSPGSRLLECLQTFTTLTGFPSDHLQPLGQMQRLIGSPFLQPFGVDLAKQILLAPLQRSPALAPASPLPLGP